MESDDEDDHHQDFPNHGGEAIDLEGDFNSDEDVEDEDEDEDQEELDQQPPVPSKGMS